jgi:hypothetical protein
MMTSIFRIVEKFLFLLQGMPFENILKICLLKEKSQNGIMELDLLPMKAQILWIWSGNWTQGDQISKI